MKKLLLGMLVIGFATQMFAQHIQTEQLKEIIISAVNYKYLDAVDNTEAALPVRALEKEVALFDLKDADFYLDEYDHYQVRFYLPQGKILAAFDRDGKIIRTVERFKNIELPREVIDAIADRHPGWVVYKDVYRVNYHEGYIKREYKVVLKKGEETIRVKLDPKGNFM